MANLATLHQWRKFAPDIGDNLSQPQGEQLLLEVKTGLSFMELGEFQTALRDTPPEAMPEMLSKYIRIVGGPHTIAGETVSTFADYWRVLAGHATDALLEVATAVPHFNSVSETHAHFSERRSGGLAFTQPRSAAKKDEKTAGP